MTCNDKYFILKIYLLIINTYLSNDSNMNNLKILYTPRKY